MNRHNQQDEESQDQKYSDSENRQEMNQGDSDTNPQEEEAICQDDLYDTNDPSDNN